MRSPKRPPTARVVADVRDGAIQGILELDASRERVFRALTSAEILCWLGGAAFRLTGWAGELRLHGAWRVTGVRSGSESTVPIRIGGEFCIFDSPRELGCTWSADWDMGERTVVEFSLAVSESGTRVVLRHKGFGSRQSCVAYADMWLGALDRLAAYTAANGSTALVR